MNRYAITLAAVSALATFALAATPPAGSSGAFKFTPAPPLLSAPGNAPVAAPSNAPVAAPSNAPSVAPSNAPIAAPSDVPVAAPSNAPVAAPSNAPLAAPSTAPVAAPSKAPVTGNPALAAPTSPSAADTSDTLLNLPNASGKMDMRGIQGTPANQAMPAGSTLDSSDTLLNVRPMTGLPNILDLPPGRPTVIGPVTRDETTGAGIHRFVDPTLPPQQMQPLRPMPVPSGTVGTPSGKAGK
jgi:hypothetical protein